MKSQEAQNIFINTVSRFKESTTAQQLISDFKNQIKLKVFKKSTLQPQVLIKKFHAIQKRYAKQGDLQVRQQWQENERKVFLWFVLAYSRLNFRKISEINDKEWNQISICFGQKNPLLLRYQSKLLERNSQRVRWTSGQEVILKKCIEGQLNGRWSEISRFIFFETTGEHFKTAKQCREHWFNHLNETIKRGQWTVKQDLIILHFVLKEGHQWCKVVEQLPSNRTEHMVKNRFGSLLTCAKKLVINPQTSNSQNSMIEVLIDELSSRHEDTDRKRLQLEANSEEEEEGSLNEESLQVKKEEHHSYNPDQKSQKLQPKQGSKKHGWQQNRRLRGQLFGKSQNSDKVIPGEKDDEKSPRLKEESEKSQQNDVRDSLNKWVNPEFPTYLPQMYPQYPAFYNPFFNPGQITWRCHSFNTLR